MRRRLYMLLNGLGLDDAPTGRTLQGDLGVKIPSSSWGYDFEIFSMECSPHDLLDAPTIIWRLAASQRDNTPAKHWREQVGRIFREENVGCRIDEKGGVHFAVDEQFERVRQSAIAGLQLPRYRAALSAFEAVQEALDQAPPNGKGAVGSTFEAIEVLFKLIDRNALHSEIKYFLNTQDSSSRGAENRHLGTPSAGGFSEHPPR